MRTRRWQSPEGWEVTAEEGEGSLSLDRPDAGGLLIARYAPGQVTWKAGKLDVHHEVARYLAYHRGGTVDWHLSQGCRPGRLLMHDIAITPAEAAAIIRGASPLEVLAPSFTVRLLSEQELMSQ